MYLSFIPAYYFHWRYLNPAHKFCRDNDAGWRLGNYTIKAWVFQVSPYIFQRSSIDLQNFRCLFLYSLFPYIKSSHSSLISPRIKNILNKFIVRFCVLHISEFIYRNALEMPLKSQFPNQYNRMWTRITWGSLDDFCLRK